MFSDADKALIEKGAKVLMDAAGKAAEYGIRGVVAEAWAGFACSGIGLIAGIILVFKGNKLMDDYDNEGIGTVMAVVGALLSLGCMLGFIHSIYNIVMVSIAPEWVLMKTVINAVK